MRYSEATLRNFLRKNLSPKQKKMVKKKFKKADVKVQKNIFKLYSFSLYCQLDIFFSRLVSNRIFVSVFSRIPRFSYFNLIISLIFPITGMSIFANLHRKDPFRKPYSRFMVFAGNKFLNRVILLQKSTPLAEEIKTRISKIMEIEYLFESYLKTFSKNETSWANYFRHQLLTVLAAPEFYSEEQLYNCLLRLSTELPNEEMELFKAQLPEQVSTQYFFFLGPAAKLHDVVSLAEQSTKTICLENVHCVSGYKFYKNLLLIDAHVNFSLLDEYTFGEVVQLSENKYFVFVKSHTKSQETLNAALLVPEFRKGFFYFFLDKALRIACFEEQGMSSEIPILIQKKLDWEIKNSLKDQLHERQLMASGAENVLIKNAYFVLQEDFEHLERRPFAIDSVAKGYFSRKLFEREDLKSRFERKKVCLSFNSKDNQVVDSALDLLARQGFEFYDDSLLTLMERIALFYYAEIVVMPIGPQLVLMSFLGKGTQLRICLKNEDIVVFKDHFSLFDGNTDRISYLDIANFSQGAAHA